MKKQILFLAILALSLVSIKAAVTSCATHVVGSGDTLCSNCNTNYYLYDPLDPASGTSYTLCYDSVLINSNFYQNRGLYSTGATGGTGIVRACPSHCLACASNTGSCTTCSSNYYRYDSSNPTSGSNYDQCVHKDSLDTTTWNSRGAWGDGTLTGTGIARACDSICVTCKDSARRCTTCLNKRPVFPIPT